MVAIVYLHFINMMQAIESTWRHAGDLIESQFAVKIKVVNKSDSYIQRMFLWQQKINRYRQLDRQLDRKNNTKENAISGVCVKVFKK